MKRFVVILAVVMVVGIASSARAQCTDPSETFVTTVTRTFSCGSSWSVGIYRRACEGLTIAAATFTPAGGVPQMVLHRGTLAEVHVPYHTGTPRFLDTTAATSGLGTNAIALVEAECMGVLVDANRICAQNHDSGYGWKYRTTFRKAESFEIFMSSQLGEYNYINKWIFRDDGVIEPEVGLTGRLQSYGSGAGYLPYGTQVNATGAAANVAKSHMHNFYYRLDFDIGGSADDAVARKSYAPSLSASPDSSCAVAGQCGTTTQTQILTEGSQVFSPTEYTSWVVYDKVIVNADGRNIGYEIKPHIVGIWRGMTSTTEPWSNADLWVTAYNGCERYAARNVTPHLDAGCGAQAANLSAMLDGASVDGVDLVVWYANRIQHVPRDEDEVHMPIEWTSFEIEPRNFHFQSPAP